MRIAKIFLRLIAGLLVSVPAFYLGIIIWGMFRHDITNDYERYMAAVRIAEENGAYQEEAKVTLPADLSSLSVDHQMTIYPSSDGKMTMLSFVTKRTKDGDKMLVYEKNNSIAAIGSCFEYCKSIYYKIDQWYEVDNTLTG